MTLIPIGTFLAGSLLTILIPILLLLALVAWYDLIFRRRGEEADTSDLGRSGTEASATDGSVHPAESTGPAAASQGPGGTV